MITEACTIVQLYQRGGADGHTLCVPIDDAGYHANRFDTRVHHPSDLSVPVEKRGTIFCPAVGGQVPRTAFAFPQAFLPMKALYDAGKVCFVNGVGSIDPTRSHFDQQLNTEVGEVTATPNKDGNGWIGRYLAHPGTTVGDGTLRALAFSTFMIPTYNGGNGVTPAYEPIGFDYPGGSVLKTHLGTVHAVIPNPIAAGLTADLGAIGKLAAVNWTAPTAGSYPASVLGSQLEKAFHVIRDQPTIEVISIDYDNIAGQRWDTHNDQGVFGGTMFNLMTDLSGSLTAFLTDTATLTNHCVIVLVYTEFGRTLKENDGKGTDHGRGGVAMLVGNTHVNGGQVYTKPGVPWITSTDDLPVHIDIRNLQGELIQDATGVPPSVVFPDTSYVHQDRGLVS
jgi:uncharacterized protein (DUF1501 family)